MAPPTWKLLLDFGEGSTFSSRRFLSDLCPCRCCWCAKCEVVKQVAELPFSALPRLYPSDDPTQQPLWSLVLIFADGSEFPSRPVQSTVGLCRYCWCEKREGEQIQESDLSTFRSFFSSETTASLKELLAGVESSGLVDPTLMFPTENDLEPAWPSINNYNSKPEEPISLKELLQQQRDRSGDKADSFIEDDQDPEWADIEGFKDSDQDRNKTSVPNRRARRVHPQVIRRRARIFNKTFLCHMCKSTFAGRNALDQHMKTHTDEPFECCLCLATFATRQQKSYHFWKHKDESGHYHCSQCNYTSIHAGNMPLHMRNHSDEKHFQCDQCPASFRHLNILKKHKLTHPRKYVFWCTECGQSFPSKNSQRLHLRKHYPTEPFKCSFCTVRFETKRELLVHQRTHIGANGLYKCIKCPYSARTAKDVVRHMIRKRKCTKVEIKQENTAEDEEQIPAQEPAKKSKPQNTQKAPETSIKSRKKPQQQQKKIAPQHSCSLCQLNFTTRDRKTSHMKQHKTEDGRYKCRNCDYTCKLISGMINHMEVEKGYQFLCTYCGKSFPDLDTYTSHKKEAHSGEKQYQCYQCSKFFHNSTNLKRHLLVHTGERPYQCNRCSRSFQTSDNFKRHQQSHA